MLNTVVLALGLVASVYCQKGFPDFVVAGKCADVPLQSNFDVRKYAGRWYQTETIDIPYQPFKKCINSMYEFSEGEDGYRVTTAGLDPNNQHHTLKGNIYHTQEFPRGHLHVDFPGVIGNPYKVINTDYETYSCVYSCIDWSGYKSEFGFVFSRTPQNSGPATQKCASVFNQNGINFSNFVSVPHSSECDYRA